MKTKHWIVFVVLSVLLASGVVWWFQNGSTVSAHEVGEQKDVTIHDKNLSLEIVTSEQDIEQGLGDRDAIPDDHGMLFQFQTTKKYTFWMRHMHFPLDMIFLKDGLVVDLIQNMPAPSQTFGIPKIYTSKAEANQVLELNVGGVEKYQIEIGSRLTL